MTLGMPTYDDFDGVWATIGHAMSLGVDDLEILVVDNNPSSPAGQATRGLCASFHAKYVPSDGVQGSAAAKNAVFEHATHDVVVCIDSHVLVSRQGLEAAKSYFDCPCTSGNMLCGPLLYDGQVLGKKTQSPPMTHMEGRWGGGAYGQWGGDPRGQNPDGSPFDIEFHGCGLMAMRRKDWPWFHPGMRGFGSEEWYIHEKARRRGGRVQCHPALQWYHRFNAWKTHAFPIKNLWRAWNYIICWDELGRDLGEVRDHYAGVGVSGEQFDTLVKKHRASEWPEFITPWPWTVKESCS